MIILGRVRTPWTAVAVALASCGCASGCRAAARNREVPPDQQQRIEAIQEKGAEASLTVFPVAMGGRGDVEAGEVVAVLLEQAGMKNLEIGKAIVRVPEGTPFDGVPRLFGAFVRDNPIDTDYALYTEFVGGPKEGVQEIRAVIVDKAGQTVLVDRQTREDRAFRRAKPDCPMACCQFLAERVRQQLEIPKSARDSSGQGRLLRRLVAASPGPDEAERAAMEQRQAIMKEFGPDATLAVFPVRFSDDEVGTPDAARLANQLNSASLCRAAAVDAPLRVKIEPSRNEQKRLWDLARALRDYVKQNPCEADYVLLADYVMHPRAHRAWAVHFVVCDRNGEWVIVDFQNEHHRDFQRIDPKSHDDCGRLVARRLRGYLR